MYTPFENSTTCIAITQGQSLTNEEFEAFWKEADVNGDGKLDYEEFIKIMSQY